MQKRPAKKKLPRDVNARAFAIGELATGNAEPESAKAQAGRKGGLKGGSARAAKMTIGSPDDGQLTFSPFG
jgi:hypothetical protein